MHHPFSDIPEIASLDASRGIIRIPNEQDIPFTPRVRAIVDTAEFQRLRHISQLGLATQIYPGANHTRFEHALGVFNNAIRYVWQLGRDARFCEVIDHHRAEVLLVSALLHDLGHWPFCHPIEDLSLPELPPHEAYAAEYLRPERELAQVLKSEWNIAPDEVLDVLVAKTDSPELRLLRSILSGPIDIDKMDYLERDSLHCGVPYGRHFDKNRLIQSLVLNEAGDGLAITQKGKTAAELMVFARYVMFSEVYWHHAVRSATCMFARAFFELHSSFDLTTLFETSETETVRLLREKAMGTDCAQLVEGVFGPKRRLYKRAGEYSHYQQNELYELLAGKPYEFLVRCGRNLTEELNRRSLVARELSPVDILIDAPPPHREVEFKVPIYFAKENRYRLLSDVSPVIESLAKKQFDDYVKRVRIFASPDIRHQLQDSAEFETALRTAVEATHP
ncbi:MAG: HD domain-containing protein [Planctomycetota bacterium]|nr:HD domain-containing protein [Planctomycetota bacterium]MDA0918294.1 HD domain-containing protein [Planctomycetota bacterium]